MLEPRNDPGEEELEEDVSRVNFPCVEVGRCVLFRASRTCASKWMVGTYDSDVLPHSPKEGYNVIHRRGPDELAIVEPEAYPKIIHEGREADHHGRDSPWASEFIPAIDIYQQV